MLSDPNNQSLDNTFQANAFGNTRSIDGGDSFLNAGHSTSTMDVLDLSQGSPEVLLMREEATRILGLM